MHAFLLRSEAGKNISRSSLTASYLLNADMETAQIEKARAGRAFCGSN
jgi:hypothetical protein